MASVAPPTPPGAVLYIDHAKHLTPLTLCYHATASRHLTSGRSDVIPPSTTAEIDSAYCPRCLTFCDAASASLGVCNKAGGGGSCKDCPVCFSPVSVSIDKNTVDADGANGQLICSYLCGYCKWSSRECGVSSNADKLLQYSSPEGESDTDTLVELEKQRGVIILEVAKELENCLQQRVNERNKNGDALFNSIANMWAQREQDEQRRKRMGTAAVAKGGRVDVGGGSWSREILEQSLMEKKKELDSLYITCQGDEINPASEEATATTPIKEEVFPTPQQMAAQMTLATSTPQSRSDLLPLPVSYRTRVSRRCRSELAAGRTGILIKPKLNPLEGDTSLRAGHGQWWKKDSSAVHVVPRVHLCRFGVDESGQKYAALLRVKNPTLNMIRLRLAGPESNDDECDIVDARELQNILVDPFSETFVEGKLCPSDTVASITPTDFFVLDPADDPFLDIGKGAVVDPLDVRSWDANAALGALGGDTVSQMRLVATQGDTAWVEMALCNDGPAEEDSSAYLAIPLSMQVEVGNGSWEASLIKRRDLPEGEQDLVTLNLVTLLRLK